MGDVVGHGLEAASLMGQLRNALRAYALEEHPPGIVVEKLDTLVQSLEQGRMATLLYLVVDADLSRSASRPPGTCRRCSSGPTASARFVEEGASVPLGVMPGGYDEAVVEIEPGSTLVLYTDGLVEERGEPIDDGLERLRQAVMGGPEDPEALCDHVLAEMGRTDRAADDVAMFVLRTVAVEVEEMTLELSTQPRALTGLRRTLGRWLEAAGASLEESQDIRMAAHEAACNSMEHAYGFEEATFKLDAVRDERRGVDRRARHRRLARAAQVGPRPRPGADARADGRGRARGGRHGHDRAHAPQDRRGRLAERQRGRRLSAGPSAQVSASASPPAWS